MKDVATSELRNHTLQVLERVEAGDGLTITVNGRPVARITSLTPRCPRWIARDAFFAAMDVVQADPALIADLDELTLEPPA
jgi:prevent-host-death family protein